MSRTIVIGDVHGCFDEVQDLLTKIGTTSDDRIIFIGDLVDRGPKVRECVDLAMKHECVLGNHENHILRIVDHLSKPPDVQKLHHIRIAPTHMDTIRALEQKHFDYFKTLPLYIKLPEFNALVVHGGIYPNVPLDMQDPGFVVRAQYIKPPDRRSYWPQKAPNSDYKFWTHFYKGELGRVIFGHSHINKPLVTEHAVGIDTGSVHGNMLTAVILPGWELISVPARQLYYGRVDRGGTGEKIQLYPVMDDIGTYS